jgi:hypothetical protein
MSKEQMEITEATLASTNEVGPCDATVYQEGVNEEAYRLIYMYFLRKARKSIIDHQLHCHNKPSKRKTKNRMGSNRGLDSNGTIHSLGSFAPPCNYSHA